MQFFGQMYRCALYTDRIVLQCRRYIPIAYHGRSSTIVVSGGGIKRPSGQIIEDHNNPVPTLQPTRRLDFELEVGVFVGGRLNERGQTLKIDNIEEYIFGIVLLNDWSGEPL